MSARPALAALAALTLAASAQTTPDSQPAPQAAQTAPGPLAAPPAAPSVPTPDQTAPVEPAAPVAPVPGKTILELRGLDKITGHATVILAPIDVPVKYETLTIVARWCYSTPPSETPETSAFLQIEDHRPDQAGKQVFSGWMYASSPGLNGMQHPLYDVWVVSCRTNAPGQAPPAVASTAPVKPVSPDAGADEKMPALPEGAGQ